MTMTPLSFILVSIPATLLLLIVACYVEAWRSIPRPPATPLPAAKTVAPSEAVEVPAWETFTYWWSRNAQTAIDYRRDRPGSPAGPPAQ
jgi:hypothetical protein